MSTYIIAELGINFNGSVELAKALIDKAASAGCDAVKFQKRTVDKVYTKEFLNSPRQSPFGTTQREQKNGIEFGEKEYDEINEYCRGKIDWYASAWDCDSQEFLKKYNLKYNKIASAMVKNTELVDMIARENKPTFISTGLGDWDLMHKLYSKFDSPVTFLHCVMKYPCPAELCNLSMITRMKHDFDCTIGYSSHNPGIVDKAIAVVLGAEALEAHITLDRSSYGTDQSASLEEKGLHDVVRNARLVKEMM